MAAPRCRPLAIAAAIVGIAAAGGLPTLLASSGQAQPPATLLTVWEPIETADHRLQQARESLEVARREHELARRQLEQRQVRSPIRITATTSPVQATA